VRSRHKYVLKLKFATAETRPKVGHDSYHVDESEYTAVSNPTYRELECL